MEGRTFEEGQTLTVKDSTTDEYPEGSTLTIRSVSSVSFGTLVVARSDEVGYPTTFYTSGRHSSSDLQTTLDVRAEYLTLA